VPGAGSIAEIGMIPNLAGWEANRAVMPL
jgi:hypothetical protein